MKKIQLKIRLLLQLFRYFYYSVKMLLETDTVIKKLLYTKLLHILNRIADYLYYIKNYKELFKK